MSESSPENTANEDEQLTNQQQNETDPQPYDMCPVYGEAIDRWGNVLDNYCLADPGCGHAIDLLCKNVNSRWAVGTARQYSYSLRCIVKYLHRRGLNVEEASVDDYMAYAERRMASGKRRQSIQIDRTVMIHLLKHIKFRRNASTVADWDEIDELLDLRNYNFKAPIERQPLSEEEIYQLFHGMNTLRDKLILHTFVETGMRQIDLRKLTVNSINFETQEIDFSNTKTNRMHTLPISDQLWLRLKFWIQYRRSEFIAGEDEGYLFPTETGGQISANRLMAIVSGAAKRAGIQEILGQRSLSDNQAERLGTDKSDLHKVTPHALRHTFKKLMVKKELGGDTRRWAMDHKSGDAHDGYGDDEQSYDKFKSALPLITFEY